MREIDLHTEADPVAVLANVLVFVGNMMGRSIHATVSGTDHYTNLFTTLVGDTAAGRKGTSMAFVRRLAALVDAKWTKTCVKSGLSSGEGVIYEVRDPSERTNQDGEPVDPGVEDKRRLIIEEELASILKVIVREGNTLSPVLRQVWDGMPLATLTKNSPCTATNAHISVIGHITRQELNRLLTETEVANGFGNRFLWLCVRRSKLLPDGGGQPNLEQFVPRLDAVLGSASLNDQVWRDKDADALWCDAYPRLTHERIGLLAAMTARAAPQVLRLSTLYAALDCSIEVEAPHMRAALAFWDYCHESARYIFGERLGDPVADTILDAVRSSGTSGVTRTNLSKLFSGHKKTGDLGAAIQRLVHAGMMQEQKDTTTSPPTMTYRAPASP